MNLKDRILEVGIENCLFMVPMRPLHSILGIFSYKSSDSEYKLVPCVINEERYKVEDNYKITLECLYPTYGKEHFYLCDLESLIRSNHIGFYVRG